MQLLDIPGIGEKIADTLISNGIETPDQLLTYYPRTHRYYHRRSISQAKVGEWTIISCTISKPFSRHTGKVSLQSATAQDDSGSLTLRWFNSPYIVRSIKPDTNYEIMGKVEIFANKLQIINPSLKIIDSDTESAPDPLILPIYTPLGTIKSGVLRNIIKSTLDVIKLTDPLKADTLAENHLYPLKKALDNIHFPDSTGDLSGAIHRLGFDELVALQTESLILKESMSPQTTALAGNQDQLNSWLTSLPFVPTSSQTQAISDVVTDLKKPYAMHRLITGDVGSGKTLVAAAGALWTDASDRQVLVLAPTQILAEQLHHSLKRLLGESVSTSLITRTQKGDPKARIVIGTHAILNNKYQFDEIGLVIIDEQHRFGVRDREKLRSLSHTPHLLMLSATPIPRTLAMTTLAHLDVTSMQDMPKDRLPVKSYVISKDRRSDAYNWIKKEIEESNQQAFIVTPLIEQAESQEESPKIALTALESELKSKFGSLRIDYVHGKMKEADKTKALDSFRKQNTDILVATSMIEVGIDLPNVNLILIENAEMFGLSTLHQLRGRVGRGGGQGHCLLISPKSDPKTTQRLGFFVREKSGIKLAEYDLSRRGPGDIFGTLQSGTLGLRFADLSDPKLLDSTRKVALAIAKNGSNQYNT